MRFLSFLNKIRNLTWNFENCFYYRFDTYEDNIDRCAFFYELNSGWYEMYGELEITMEDVDYETTI